MMILTMMAYCKFIDTNTNYAGADNIEIMEDGVR